MSETHDSTQALRRPRMRELASPFVGAIAIALCARLAFPFPGSPVPISAQTLAVLLVGLLLGSRRGLLAVGLYLGAGALGSPVFAEGASGFHHLRGPTGGYLLAFAAAAWLVGRFKEQGWALNFPGALVASLLGHILILAAGTLWLSSFLGIERALTSGCYPFLVGGLVKSAVGAAVVSGWPFDPS